MITFAKFDITDLSIRKIAKVTELAVRGASKEHVFVISRDNQQELLAYNLKTSQLAWSWKFTMNSNSLAHQIFFFEDLIFLTFSNEGVYALDVFTGNVVWNKNFHISTFDDKKGLIYILSSNYIVIDATNGNDVLRIGDWAEKQIEKYPALANIQTMPHLSDEYLVFSSRTREDKIEGGVFFIDKNTAEVKDYFRIVFDKDPVQRKDWDGNKIPDDQQIPFMPLEMPIYKDGKLYVVLPSPIEGQKDLYIYERDD